MMHAHSFFAALFMSAIIPVPGLASEQINDCALIDTDLERLACYDQISGRSPTPENIELNNDTGQWIVRKDKSEFKDTTDVFLSVESDEILRCGMFTQAKAQLLLRCLENTTTLYISTSCHVASGFQGYGRVEYRIDEKKAASRNFDASTDNRALGLWSGNRSIPVIKQMLDGETLLVRFTPFNESPVTARFNISGLNNAISPLREACHW